MTEYIPYIIVFCAGAICGLFVNVWPMVRHAVKKVSDEDQREREKIVVSTQKQVDELQARLDSITEILRREATENIRVALKAHGVEWDGGKQIKFIKP